MVDTCYSLSPMRGHSKILSYNAGLSSVPEKLVLKANQIPGASFIVGKRRISGTLESPAYILCWLCIRAFLTTQGPYQASQKEYVHDHK